MSAKAIKLAFWSLLILWPVGCFLVWWGTTDTGIGDILVAGWMMGVTIFIFILIVGTVLLWVMKFIFEIVTAVRGN